MSELHEILEKRIGRGAVMGRRKGSSDPFSNPERDLGHAWRPIFKQAVVATQKKYIEAEDAVALEVLDTISHMFIRLYAEAFSNNLTGLQLFGQMYDYLKDYGDVGKQVYAEFCSQVVQTLVCYLFTVQEMTIGLPDTIGEKTDEYTGILNVITSLTPETRKKVLEELDENGVWPRLVDYGPLKRELDNYIDVIQRDQQRRYAEMEAKEKEQQDG